MCWHEEGEHTKKEVADALTGQVPVDLVSGNLDRDALVLGTWNA